MNGKGTLLAAVATAMAAALWHVSPVAAQSPPTDQEAGQGEPDPEPAPAGDPASSPGVSAEAGAESSPDTATEAVPAPVVPGEVIIVTATKRETDLQDTPVAVSVLTGESLERQQAVDLKSVTALVPNLQIGSHGDSAAVDTSLRGIVSTNRTELGDPAVAFHVDGFYSPRPQGATTLLYDLERIEVLRGPQGTLFGRNANAGVINITTAKPVLGATSASTDLTVGTYDLLRVKGHLNAPLVDGLAVRGAMYLEQREGFIEFQDGSQVPAGSARYDNSDKAAFRVSGLWEPTSEVRVFVSGERFMDRGAGTVPVLIDPRPGTDLRSALIDSPGSLDLLNTTFHGRVDYRPIDWVELSYLGGYGLMRRSNVNDNDVGFNPTDNFQQEHRTESSRFSSQSHELQIKSRGLDRVDFIAGAFLYRENNRIRFDIDINDDPDGDGIQDQYWAMSFVQPKRVLDSVAGFGQVTGHVMDELRLTAGARYTSDQKSDTGGRNLVCPGFGATFETGGINLRDTSGLPMAPDPFGGLPHPDRSCGSFPGTMGNDVEKRWSKLTWMGRAEFDATRDLLAYGLVNTGFKSGVIQDGGATADPEFVTNYELGAKATLLEGALRVNPVAFFSDYTDILRSRAEVQADGSQQLVTRNATEARIFGLEVDALWFATDRDRVQLVASYLNAEYKDFPNIDNVLYATNDPDSPIINLEGNKLPFSPTFSVAAAFEHRFSLPGGGSIVPRIQSRFQTEMYLSDFNRDSDRQGAYTITDLSLRYMTRSGWLAEVFVQNVEDSAVKSNVEIKGNSPGAGGVPGDPGLAFAYYNAPRTGGVRLSYTWNGAFR